MKAKLIANPYFIYSLSFLLIVILYYFNWSALYPKLSVELLVFILITSLISLVTGIIFHQTNYLTYKPVNYNHRTLWMITIIVFFGYLVECAYMGVIPLLAILGGATYDYTTFGIPTFHVILATFNSFWAVFIFHNFISTRKWHLFICYLLCLFPAILIFNRGMLLLNLGSSFFVLFMSSKNIFRLTFRISVFLIGILFLFGVAGNVRITGGKSVNNLILDWGHATTEFRKSSIPKEFFWAYLYISSPLANAQTTINYHKKTDFSDKRLGAFLNWELLPDFISKRNPYFVDVQETVNRISPSFTVGTVYARGYSFLGWLGPILMFVYIVLFNLFIILVMPKRSVFFVTGIAILDCLMLFNIFDNMFAFSGLSLQLFYPVVFGLLSKIKLKPKAVPGDLIIQSN